MNIGAAIHDSGRIGHDHAELTGRFEHQPRRLGADQVTRRGSRQRIGRGVERLILVFVEVRVVRVVRGIVGECRWSDSEGPDQQQRKQNPHDSPTHGTTLTTKDQYR